MERKFNKRALLYISIDNRKAEGIISRLFLGKFALLENKLSITKLG